MNLQNMQKYSPVPNNSPPRLFIFGFFVGPPHPPPHPPLLSYLDPPFINFPGFVLQVFQRLLKRIVLFTKLLAVYFKQL